MWVVSGGRLRQAILDKGVGEYEVRLKLFDTHTAGLIGQQSVTGRNLKSLREDLRAKARDLFKQALGDEVSNAGPTKPQDGTSKDTDGLEIGTIKHGVEFDRGSSQSVKARELQSRIIEGTNWTQTTGHWFSVAFQHWNKIPGFEVSFFTLRWPYVYWEMARGSFGALTTTDSISATFGTSLGFPIHLGTTWKHEIRIGLDINPVTLIVQGQDDEGNDCGGFGFGLGLRLFYAYRVARHFEIRTGVVIYLPIVEYDGSIFIESSGAGVTFGFAF